MVSAEMVGLAVLGVILLLVIIGGGLAIYFILRKLKQHENDILRLSGEGRSVNVSNHTMPRSFRDSAIKLNETSSYRQNGSSRPLSQTSAISNSRSIQPKMSLIIKSEECRIYGERPPFGQILMTAQNYYKATTKTDTIVPTEEVQVVDKVNNRRTAVSKVFTEDWREGLPTSLLLNGDATSFENVFSINKGVFVHKTIGTKGGLIKVSGVTLNIPPGALENDTLISLGLLWDKKYLPPMTIKKAMLSPIVVCQPSGLTFRIPVTLNFPHAAARITQDWVPAVLKREGSLTEQHEWEPITLADYEEREITETHISLKLHHFTLYTLVGESQPGKTAAKLVHIVAFTGKLQKNAYFKPRLFCLNKYKEELEEVETLNRKMDPSSRIAETSDLFVHDNNKDITLEVHKMSEEWNLTSDRTEVLPFEQVWHSFHPHCTFVMKKKKTCVKEIMCEIHAYQNGDENNIAKLKIAEQIEQSISPLSSPEDDHVEGLIRQLVILLDPANSVGTDAGDWKDLASKMGCGIPRIRWLGTQSSPTRILLEKWLEDKGEKFEELEEIMNNLNRPDAAEEVRNVMSKLNDSDEDNELS